MRTYSSRALAAVLAAGWILAAAADAGFPSQTSGYLPSGATSRQLRDLRLDNVVLMIPDGTGIAHMTLGRWYKYVKTGVNRLAFDELASGLVRTYWATGLITDSAPAAAGMATGFKTSYGSIGLRPARVTMPDVPPVSADEALTPVATVLEAARARGLSTGLVVTCEFPHATPAGFSSHYPQRSAMEILAEQQVDQGIDVVLGGGRRYLDPKIRKDGEDLAETLRQRGYAYLTDAAGLAAAPAGRMWGVFAEAGMSRDLDRDPAGEPSLEEMTKKALTTLSRNKKGFFLMVEGSQVDWGAHANDPVGTASEILAFEKAFAAVMDFARKDGHTAVLIAADHSTGGLSIGNPDVGDLPMERFARAMSRPKVTATKAAALIMADASPSLDKARLAADDLLGIDDWKPAEIPELEAALQEKSAKKLELFLARALSRRAGVGWVFTGHGGEDVALYCFHPKGPRLSGVVQNTDIGLYIAQCLGFDLAGLTAERFIRAETAFRPVGASLSVDVADPENPVLVAAAKGRVLRLPMNKSRGILDGRTVDLDGVVVCTGAIGAASVANPKNWFVSRRTAALLR